MSQSPISIYSDNSVLFGTLEHFSQSIVIVDEFGKVLYVNTPTYDLLAITNKNDVIGKDFFSIDVSFRDLNGADKLHDIIYENQIVSYEGILSDIHNNRLYVEYNISRFLTEPHSAVIFITPISRLKEGDLLRQSILFREIMNSTVEGIFIVNGADELIEECNNKAVELFGFTNKTEMKGAKVRSLQRFPYSQEVIDQLVEQLRVTGTWSTETEYISKSGRVFWCATEVSVMRLQSEAPHYLIRLIDIDVKKKAEENLRETKKRYEDLVNHNQALICTHDEDGNILSVNPACLKSLDYEKAEDLIGKNLKILFDPKSMEGYHQYIRQINEEGEASGIMKVVSSTNQKMYWLYHNYKVNEDGNSYIVGSAQDITDRIHTEKELKKAKQLAEKSLKARELFLANVSHELRTPIHGILGVNNMLAKTHLDKEQLNYSEIINRSAENLLFLVNDILDVAKMESGKFELESIPFDIKDIIISTTEPLLLKAKEKGIVCNILLPTEPLITVQGDAHRLAQVISNLISNAIKFTDRGSVELVVKVVVDTPHAYVINIEVKDTGIGIPVDKQRFVFDGYTQVSTSHARIFGGTGLGLSICEKLIKAQNGNIYCTSTEGEGSNFGFVITYLKDNTGAQVQNPEHKIDYSQFSGLKILLVEDNPVNQLICKFLLDQKGVLVDLAEDGAQTFDLVSLNDYDLILMDIMLPDIGGKEITYEIRALPDTHKAKTPIIALTANAMKGDRESYLNAGMNGYLSKPYTEEELFQEMALVLKMAFIEKSTPDRSYSPISREVSADIYDLEIVKLHFKEDLKAVREFLHDCIMEIPLSLNSMEKAIQDRSIDVIASLLEGFVSNLNVFHNTTISSLLNRIMYDIRNSKQFQLLIPDLYKLYALLQLVVIKNKKDYISL